jgi:hypothetical protein
MNMATHKVRKEGERYRRDKGEEEVRWILKIEKKLYLTEFQQALPQTCYVAICNNKSVTLNC